ncbi:unnamed protein product [Brachionus calyciflorus]|uniref:Uncharacterized protein n=1 Tax=Brachionus calyciflorus TaxID=104777 RepID=A0A814EED9_9BILA|nr:unnamed protein product [Brachionus calyciflorus]
MQGHSKYDRSEINTILDKFMNRKLNHADNALSKNSASINNYENEINIMKKNVENKVNDLNSVKKEVEIQFYLKTNSNNYKSCGYKNNQVYLNQLSIENDIFCVQET